MRRSFCPEARACWLCGTVTGRSLVEESGSDCRESTRARVGKPCVDTMMRSRPLRARLNCKSPAPRNRGPKAARDAASRPDARRLELYTTVVSTLASVESRRPSAPCSSASMGGTIDDASRAAINPGASSVCSVPEQVRLCLPPPTDVQNFPTPARPGTCAPDTRLPCRVHTARRVHRCDVAVASVRGIVAVSVPGPVNRSLQLRPSAARTTPPLWLAANYCYQASVLTVFRLADGVHTPNAISFPVVPILPRRPAPSLLSATTASLSTLVQT